MEREAEGRVWGLGFWGLCRHTPKARAEKGATLGSCGFGVSGEQGVRLARVLCSRGSWSLEFLSLEPTNPVSFRS